MILLYSIRQVLVRLLITLHFGVVLIDWSSCAFTDMIPTMLALMASMSLYLFVASIASRGGPSSSGVSSPSVFCKRDSASAVWCLTPAWWATSDSILESRKFQRAILLVLSVRSRVHYKES